MIDATPAGDDLQRDLDRERRAHAITRGLLAQVTQELAETTLTAEQLIAALQPQTAPREPQEAAE